ncbi:hypothetical protein RND81_06G084000 [Saponaria officinalis]|uniref:Uncharacterized protein n=1 Tax=Saponaria officinalis TaxID=3572 RepID=A0AAW1K4F6_SAPOF
MSNPSSPPLTPPSSPPSQPPEFPPIEPTNFDPIIVGTSLPSSVLSAAASSAGKTVLHLDPNPFYGSLFSSLPPLSLSSLLLPTRRLLSAVDLPPLPPHLHPLAPKFSLDVSGPRVLFSADASIDLLVKSGVSDYMQFKAIDESLIFDVDSRRLISVPDSRAAIFKDKGLSLKEKNQLMKLFKLVQLHLSGDDDDARISEDDLERPFFEFLSKMLLPKKIIGYGFSCLFVWDWILFAYVSYNVGRFLIVLNYELFETREHYGFLCFFVIEFLSSIHLKITI